MAGGMSAVLRTRARERDRDQPREVHERCVEWARWARCARPGAEGTAEGYLRERTAPGHAGEPSPEVALTELAVAKMYVERPQYKPAFDRYYLNPTELSEEEVADLIHYTVERVNAILRQARILIQQKLLQLERLRA